MIITEDEAKLSLRLGGTLDTTDQADLELAIAQAEGIYLEYHPEWLNDSPAIVTDSMKAAVLLLLHAIWDNRGDNPLAKAYDLMRMNRGPALA